MLSMERTAPQQEFLDIITFPYDDETRRHLISFYKYKETLLDPDLVHEHLINQPVLGVTLLFLLFLATSIFLFSVVFISCRALGNCGAKRYQPHPTNGRCYTIWLVVFLTSWVILAGSSLHFLFSGITFWNQRIPYEYLNENHTVFRRHANDYPDYSMPHTVKKRGAFKQQSVFDLFDDIDYEGDFEQLVVKSTTTAPPFVTIATTKKLEDMVPVPIGLNSNSKRKSQLAIDKKSSRSTRSPAVITLPIRPIPKDNVTETHLVPSRVPSHSLDPPLTSPISILKRPHAEKEFGRMLIKTKKASSIRNPFVSDTWKKTVSRTANKVIRPLTTVSVFMEASDAQQNNVEFDEQTLLKSLASDSTDHSNNVIVLKEGDQNLTQHDNSISIERFEESAELRNSSNTVTTDETNDRITKGTPAPLITFLAMSTKITTTPNTQTTVNLIRSDRTGITVTEHTSPLSDITPNPTTTRTEPSETTPLLIITSTNSMPLYKLVVEESPSSKSLEDETKLDINVIHTTAKTTMEPLLQETKSWADIQTQSPLIDLNNHDDDEDEDFSKNIVDDTAFMAIVNDHSKGSSKENDAQQNKNDEWTLQDSTTYPFISRMHNYSTTRPSLINTFPRENLDGEHSSGKIEQLTTALRFPFHSLHTSGTIWLTRISLVLIGLLMVFVVLPSLFLVVAGSVCYMSSYHPMDRTIISEKIGQMSVLLATVLLFSIPCLILYVDFVLAYSHIHNALCPTLQLQYQQELGIISELSSLTLQSPSLIERMFINTENCQRSLTSVQGLWTACLLFALSSIPIVFSLFKLSKYYLRMKTEYYWTLADNYGTLRPKRLNSEGIYGNIYGSLRIKRPASRPPQSQPIYAESPIYSDGPIYGAYGAYGRI